MTPTVGWGDWQAGEVGIIELNTDFQYGGAMMVVDFLTLAGIDLESLTCVL